MNRLWQSWRDVWLKWRFRRACARLATLRRVNRELWLLYEEHGWEPAGIAANAHDVELIEAIGVTRYLADALYPPVDSQGEVT